MTSPSPDQHRTRYNAWHEANCQCNIEALSLNPTEAQQYRTAYLQAADQAYSPDSTHGTQHTLPLNSTAR